MAADAKVGTLMEETLVFEYAEPEGTVWVKIEQAIEENNYRDGRGVIDRFPVLRVSTFAEGRIVDEHRRYVTLRGRKYSFDQVHVWRDYGQNQQWTGEHRQYHSRRYENESHSPVAFNSPVRDRMRDIEQRVRDRFVAEHPDWVRTSLRLRVAWLARQADSEALSLRQQAAKEQAKAEQFRAELAAI